MAARKRALYLDDQWKEKIGVSMLVNRLKRFANSKFNPTSDDYMAPHQVQAANILLKKVIPDLAAVEHKGEVQIRPVIDPEPTPVEWKEAFAEPVKLPEFDRSVTEEDILKKLEPVIDPKP